MTSKLEIAEALDAAAQYIEEHGWAQGVLKTESGAVCAMGAIAEVTPNPWTEGVDVGVPYYLTKREMTMRALNEHIAVTTRWSSIAQWNDFKGRAKPDTVIRGIRAAALNLRIRANNETESI